MVTPATGGVVLVPFPFSDLSQSKLRPAIALASAERGDWILCQVTSNAYAGSTAVELMNSDLRTGSLNRTSYARPGKIFTANEAIISTQVGILTDEAYRRVIGAVVALLQANLPKAQGGI